MQVIVRRSIRVLTLVGVLIAGFGVAQHHHNNAPASQSQALRHQGFNPGMSESGMGEFGGEFVFGHGLELGTKLTLTFYNADLASGGKLLSTLNFTYGTDSEVAFTRQLEEAKATAAYLKVDTSEQTRAVDLSRFDETQRQTLRPRELAMIATLNEGTILTTTFYDGDPAASGKSLDTFTFTYGKSSEAGFANDFATAAKTAAFVTITTSAQTQSIDLAVFTSHSLQDGESQGEDRVGHHSQGDTFRTQHGFRSGNEGSHGTALNHSSGQGFGHSH
jgi:hypothetical protein